MTEAFCPLSPATFFTGAASLPASSRAVAPAPALPRFDPLKTQAEPLSHPAGNCAGSPPAVTLQRNGDVVTGIRVQCGCGEVIELDCVY